MSLGTEEFRTATKENVKQWPEVGFIYGLQVTIDLSADSFVSRWLSGHCGSEVLQGRLSLVPNGVSYWY